MLALVLAAGLAAPTVEAKIDAYVAPYAERRDLSGVVLVKQSGATLYRKSFGRANFELDVPINDRNVFRIASLTKTFTAGAVYALERQGKLAFEDKLSRFLPGFPKAEAITLRHLLSHSSGVGAPDLEDLLHRETTLDEVVARIAATPFQFEPGADNAYSNSGYTLLAKVIEQVSGTSYDAFLRTTFFEPLGLAHTASYRQADLVAGRASAYVPGPPPAGVSPVAGYEEGAYLGAGSLWSTADDLSTWIEAVHSGRFFDLDRLNWPMGWGKRTYFERRANEQTGIATGFASGMIFFPAEKVEVIVLTNVQTQFAGRAVREIAGIVLGQPIEPLPAPQLVDIAVVDLPTVVGRYSGENIGPLEIRLRDGHLYYRWQSSAEDRYLAPTGRHELYARDEFASWRFTPAGFTWDGPFGKLELRRLPP